jgi:hypothetical protein
MPPQVAVAAPVAPAANRRVSVRYPCRSGTAGRLTLAGEYISRAARVLDVSTGGVALRLSQRVRRGTALFLQLYNAELQFHYTLSVRVAHTTALPGRKWLVGCAFDRELSPQELASLALTADA